LRAVQHGLGRSVQKLEGAFCRGRSAATAEMPIPRWAAAPASLEARGWLRPRIYQKTHARPFCLHALDFQERRLSSSFPQVPEMKLCDIAFCEDW
jgi:hypothetical protein